MVVFLFTLSFTARYFFSGNNCNIVDYAHRIHSLWSLKEKSRFLSLYSERKQTVNKKWWNYIRNMRVAKYKWEYGTVEKKEIAADNEVLQFLVVAVLPSLSIANIVNATTENVNLLFYNEKFFSFCVVVFQFPFLQYLIELCQPQLYCRPVTLR